MWSKWSIVPKSIKSVLESFHPMGLGIIRNAELLWETLDFPGSKWGISPNIFRLTHIYLNFSNSLFFCFLFFVFFPSLHFSGALIVLSLTLYSFSTKLGLQDYCVAINFKQWVWSFKWNKYFFEVGIPFLIPIYPQSTDFAIVPIIIDQMLTRLSTLMSGALFYSPL